MTTSDAVETDALKRFEIFDGLDRSELERLAAACDRTHFDGGERLITEGDTSRRLYAMLEGRVEVLKSDATGEDRQLAVLEGPTFFGEHGFVLAQPRTATVRALNDADALVLGGEAFDRLDAERSEIARKIEQNLLRVLAERQTDMNRELLRLLEETDEGATFQFHESDEVRDDLMRRWTV